MHRLGLLAIIHVFTIFLSSGTLRTYSPTFHRARLQSWRCHGAAGVVATVDRLGGRVLRVPVVEAAVAVEALAAHDRVDGLGLVALRDPGGVVLVVTVPRVEPHAEDLRRDPSVSCSKESGRESALRTGTVNFAISMDFKIHLVAQKIHLTGLAS